MHAVFLQRWDRAAIAVAVVLCVAPLAVAQPATAKKPKRAAIAIERDVEIPMRDGTILRADILRPAAGGPYPVLLHRTPYGKSPRARWFAEAGYIVVNQDARGRYASDGEFESYYREQTHCADDGFDTVAWCARLPNSTGVVGTFGSSYNALLQWKTASSAPPALHCMAAFTIPARHTDLEGPGSFRPARRLQWWYGTMSSDLRKRSGGPQPYEKKASDATLKNGLHDKLLGWLPWSTLPDEVLSVEKPFVLAYLRRPQVDMWHLDACATQTRVPNLNVCGWYDHCNGSIDLHTAIVAGGATEQARRESKLIVGPWNHGGLGQRAVNGFDFGPAAEMNLEQLQIDWFNHYLKGVDNGAETAPSVRIFVMGRNAWLDEPEWPLRRAAHRSMYLSSAGGANTAAGDGTLSARRPREGATDRYTYDPKNPVPSNFPGVGYTVPVDQRSIDGRDDVLVYQSSPLDAPLAVIGYPTMELFAASSAPDTDFIVKLVDVPPDDGPARDVSIGIVRARYRDGSVEPVLLEPGEIVKYTIRMKPTAIEFQPGHKIRVQVTSSDWPSFDRNHNTAADPNFDATLAVAEQTIHHGAAYASRIELPVINSLPSAGVESK